MHADVTSSINSIDSTTTYDKDGERKTTFKIKMHDKLRALEILSKYYGLLVEKTEVVHTVAAQTIEQARAMLLADPAAEDGKDAIDIEPL